MKYLSKIFHPCISTPKDAIIKNKNIACKSHKLMLNLGIIKHTSGTGLFSFLPMGIRALNKLNKIVETKMDDIGAQKISMPIFAPEELWIKSGRLKAMDHELMKMKDNQAKSYIICPTYEETITDLIASLSPMTQKHFPLYLYQMGNKYRDEMRPRYGLIRSREFLMKDLYTFDVNEHLSRKTYDLISEAYDQIFTSIGVRYIKAEGCTGNIGGDLSHEIHYPTPIGEDSVLECNTCNYKVTEDLLVKLRNESSLNCPKCKSSNFTNYPAIEVAHTFLLGTKYSSTLKAFTCGSTPIHMGCYGIGLSRIIAAALEVLSTETELRWPLSLAPFTVCFIGPKEGSKEEINNTSRFLGEIYSNLIECCPSLNDDIIIDDRTEYTIGRRFVEAKRFGYPFVVIIGKKANSEHPQFELFDAYENKTHCLNEAGVIEKIQTTLTRVKNNSNFNYMENYCITNEDLTENTLK